MYETVIQEIDAKTCYTSPPDYLPFFSWFNSPPLSLKNDLKGSIVVLRFWTSSCIHCIQSLPHFESLVKRLDFPEFAYIDIYTPQYEAEKKTDHVKHNLKKRGILRATALDIHCRYAQYFQLVCLPSAIVIGPKGNFLQTFTGEFFWEPLSNFLMASRDFYQQSCATSNPLKKRTEETAKSDTLLSYPTKIVSHQKISQFFISDTANHRIVVTNKEGEILHIIGNGDAELKDGSFADASFHFPQGLTCRDNSLYVADTGNHAIREINLKEKKVRTLAGDGTAGYDYFGKNKRNPRLTSPTDLVWLQENLYITMSGTHQIWCCSSKTKELFCFSGTGAPLLGDGCMLEIACFYEPQGICQNENGSQLFVADSGNNAIRLLDLNYFLCVTLVSSSRASSSMPSEIRQQARKIEYPQGILYLSRKKKLYIANSYLHTISCINLEQNVIEHVTGKPHSGYKDGAFDQAEFNEPCGIAYLPNEDALLICDKNNCAIRKIDLSSKVVSTLKIH